MPIQWYPGHMAKAKREITEVLPLVDIVLELRDARIPLSSKNPMIDDILKNKPRLILLNKASIADKKETEKWILALTKDNTYAMDIDSINGYNMNKIQSKIFEILKEKLDNLKAKGVANKTVRAVVVGIPNVGKSTFINFMAKKKVAKTGDKPGVTKIQSWLNISKDLQFMDTPGILWPKFESEEVGINLAICGSIKDEIVDLELVCQRAIMYISQNYKSYLIERYNLKDTDFGAIDEQGILPQVKAIARNRGCLLKGNEYDLERVFTIVMNDIRNNRIGAMSFEKAE